ncbi:thiamine pyrophosphate-dependent enzyme [Streptomyces sp. NPDC101151]|uniref:thiamine pyrophosphate-dependent enzyme n=1 Tax=Streptomyces sp. NPDC101151 TaxID=3366115 RepID=UPI0038055B1C
MGLGIPGVSVDGNDIEAVRDCVASAVERARTGEGLTLVEAVTYRKTDFSGADRGGYRPGGGRCRFHRSTGTRAAAAAHCGHRPCTGRGRGAAGPPGGGGRGRLRPVEPVAGAGGLGLLTSAIRCDDQVVVFEGKRFRLQRPRPRRRTPGPARDGPRRKQAAAMVDRELFALHSWTQGALSVPPRIRDLAARVRDRRSVQPSWPLRPADMRRTATTAPGRYQIRHQ